MHLYESIYVHLAEKRGTAAQGGATGNAIAAGRVRCVASYSEHPVNKFFINHFHVILLYYFSFFLSRNYSYFFITLQANTNFRKIIFY